MAKYSYTKDVAGFNISQLAYEIEQNATIVTTLDYIDFAQPDLDIYFDGTLSGGEETELGTVVAASPNANLPQPEEDVVANLLDGAIDGLKLKPDDTNPTYQINILKGSCRDSTGIHTIKTGVTKTVDITASGAGGLDTGSEASSTWYAVYLIDDTSGTNNPAGILSTNTTTPTLPNGYNVFRRIGWVRNDSSSDLLEFAQRGTGNERRYFWLEGKPTINVLSAGSATTWTDVDMSSLMPPTSTVVYLNVGFRTTAAGDASHILQLRMKGASKQVIEVAPGSKNTSNMYVPVVLNTTNNQVIQYIVSDSNNACGLWLYGWEDEL